MVAVITSGMNAEMWLPAAHFTAGSKRLRWAAQPIFQTTGLVMPEGSAAHGR
ncbi:MAG: hypothetical protein QOD10_2439 [Mycobacterium sp.]|jgi:hypothetical protein|nr:hypothetical protein [Mycobacterium sp.]